MESNQLIELAKLWIHEENGEAHFKALPAAAYLDFPRQSFRVICHYMARYGIPTAELVQWLRDEIEPYRDPKNDRFAIEVGAGYGDLAWNLGIHPTDSHIQTTPEIRAMFEVMGQPPVVPPASVERIEALEAVRKYKPRVVIASWLSQKSVEGDPGFIFGADEEAILDSGIEKYIFHGS